MAAKVKSNCLEDKAAQLKNFYKILEVGNY